MSEDVNNAAAPSSAVAIADNWDENGTPIVSKKTDPAAKAEKSPVAEKSSPSKDASAASKPASEAGGKESGSGPGKKERDEERNWRALETDRDGERQKREAAEKELEDWRSGRKKSEEKKAEPTKKAEPPKRPNPFTWTGTQEDFDKAMDEYEQHRDALAVARVRQEQAQTEAQKSMSEMLKQATAKHPDAEVKIKAATTDIMGKAPLFVQSFVNDSEVLGDLLYTLADQTTLNNLLETAKTNPGKALRVLRDMELDIQKALKKPETKVEAKSEEKASEVRPRAPKPPSEVTGRSSATEDAATSAARDGNFGAFDAEMAARHFKAS